MQTFTESKLGDFLKLNCFPGQVLTPDVPRLTLGSPFVRFVHALLSLFHLCIFRLTTQSQTDLSYSLILYVHSYVSTGKYKIPQTSM